MSELDSNMQFPLFFEEVVNELLRAFGRFRGVKTYRYQSDDLNNAQHNEEDIQVYIDDVSYQEFVITKNLIKGEFNVYILKHPTKEPDSIKKVQSECYNVAVNVMALLQNDNSYNGFLRPYDWSIITLSHYTAQDSAGVKLSLVLELPNPIDLCRLWEMFDDEAYRKPEGQEVSLPEINELPIEGDLILNPVKLPKSSCK